MIQHLFYIFLSFSFMLGLQAQLPTPVSPATAKIGQPALLDETLNLARGHQEFQDLFFKQNESEFVRLIKEGQNPQTLFVGCSDSRVMPELILNSRPGELFVIRTAGNFVTPFNFQPIDGVAATIQFAVEVLNVRHIIVCGHSHCGAIRGLFQNLDPDKLGILKRWIQLGEEAKKLALQSATPSTSQEDIYTTAEEISVLVQLQHLLTYPFVKKRVNDKTIELHGWYFDIQSGQLWYYNTQQNRFLPLVFNNRPNNEALKK